MNNKYDIAAIIWPSYTGDEPRSRIFWPEGYGEWQTVKAMKNKGYEGCRWPRKPLWGYVNEADSYVMEMQIKAATDHGVNVFIYDWYWYDNRPFLENCLNDGFLKASNNTDMRFYLMWANHDATYLWDTRISSDTSTVVWKGAVTEKIYDEICDRTIEKYFMRDNYYLIDGCPVYMIFDIDNFIRTFSSVDDAAAALQRFREKTVAAGFKGLHLQLAFFKDGVCYAVKKDDPEYGITKRKLMERLGFDSFTNYNWACSMNIDDDFSVVAENFNQLYDEYTSWETSYYPNLTVGWDNNLRFTEFKKGVIRNNPPEEFEKACINAKSYIDRNLEGRLRAPLITVNSWNEWTEGSYLEPDDLYGYGYLQTLKKVFKTD